MALCGSHHALQPVGICHRIRIEQGQPRRLALPRSHIIASCKAKIARLWQEAIAWYALAVQIGRRTISRRIVDEEHFEIAKCLVAQGIERLLQERLAIIIHNDDRDGNHECHLLVEPLAKVKPRSAMPSGRTIGPAVRRSGCLTTRERLATCLAKSNHPFQHDRDCLL